MPKRIVALVGSYRKGCSVDSLVDAVLEGAREKGAETEKIYLLDRRIEFCTNCRSCTQEPGPVRGTCIQKDDLDGVLSRLEGADALGLAAPVNFYTLNALTRRFMERLVCYAYWPWGKQGGPVQRNKILSKKAVLISTSAMPGIFIPVATGAPRALKSTAWILGARPVGTLWLGLTAVHARQDLPPRAQERARKLGLRLTA